jgi:outer membrane biosynthesis protein TonB
MATSSHKERSLDSYFNFFLLGSLLLHACVWLLLMTVEPPPPPSQQEYARWVQKVTPPKIVEEVVLTEKVEAVKKPVVEEEIEDEGEPVPSSAKISTAPRGTRGGKGPVGPSGGPLGGPMGRPGLKQQLSGAGLLAQIGVASEGGGLANIFESGSAVVGKDLGEALSERPSVRVGGGTRIGRKGALGAGTGADIGEVDAGGGGGGPGAEVGTMAAQKRSDSVAPKAFVKSTEAIIKKGGIDEKGVHMALRRREQSIQQCYKRALKTNVKLKGKIMIEWHIDESGRVVSISVLQNTIGDKSLADCVLDIISRIRFPKAQKGIVPVSKPFIFEPGSF